MSSPASQLRSRVPRIAGAAVERARLTVVPRTRAVRAARVPFVLFVSLILLLGVVGLLMFNTSMQQASFTMGTYQERATRLAAREEQLNAELEDLRDPERLGVKAQRQGMVLPDCTGFLHTATGTVGGAPCPTVGAKLPLGQREPKVPKALDPDPIVVSLPPTPPAATTATPPPGVSSDAAVDRGDKQDKRKSRNRNR
ncbi:hypothetical protein [Nocardioides sp. W7]|uniref:hypothetical protein n=1 Tax=Nocardioides sp. W7 TaxID=2931390 RepID=UPI001FD505E7|nr:hypothetical protein [Nocardioides sp. W7]